MHQRKTEGKILFSLVWTGPKTDRETRSERLRRIERPVVKG